jgi:transmembrane sensor
MSDPDSKADEAWDEASAWFARLNRRTVSNDTLTAFQVWRGEPQNAAAYAEVEKLWRLSSGLIGDKDIQTAISEALSRGPARRSTVSDFFETPTRREILSIAGVVAFAGLLVAGLAHLQAGTVYATKVGEQRLVRMEDGSQVRLDTDTKVTARMSKTARDLDLIRGRAFFDVAHDPQRPFTVAAGSSTIRATGTRFDVARGPKAVEVNLVKGQVEVRQSAGAALILQPGQQLILNPDLPPSPPRSVDVSVQTSWTSGRLDFRAVPLREAIAEVNRYTPRQIRLHAPSLSQTPVSGVFNTGDSEAFIAAVSDLYDLHASRSPNGDVVLEAVSGRPPTGEN